MAPIINSLTGRHYNKAHTERIFMAPQAFVSKRTAHELRYYTAAIAKVMHLAISAQHQDAIAQYAAHSLPKATLKTLHTRCGKTAALQFIARTLQ
jgi:hypothetical protein